MTLGPGPIRRGNILVVDDTAPNLVLLAGLLNRRGHKARPVPSGKLALQAAQRDPPDLVLLDINMPDMDGFEVCRALKADPRLASVPVIFISADDEPAEKAKALAAGGVDYITKPFQFAEVEARVATHLELRYAQLELERLRGATATGPIEPGEGQKLRAAAAARTATIAALAALSAARDGYSAVHVPRMQAVSRALALQLARDGSFAGEVDAPFADDLFEASALHDIGKIGLPDALLLRRGSLAPLEQQLLQRHTVLGAEALAAVLAGHPDDRVARLAVAAARSHHERFCGGGYPDGLTGEAIPVAARIVALADQLVALRSERPHRSALDEASVLTILTRGDGRTDPSHFDPRVLRALLGCAQELERILGSGSPAGSA
jgi:putative two-component system response regulator